jgi:ribosomal protein S18 acetylase RimI-like enzyme
MTPLCRLLDWDTDFFELRIARYLRPVMSPDQAGRVREWCRENRIDCLYFLADPCCAKSLSSARRLGMTPAGIRVELEAPAEAIPYEPVPPWIRPAAAADLKALRALAPTLHRASRFFVDPGFGRSRAAALYEVWITKCFYQPSCTLFVSDTGKGPEGYCAVASTGTEGSIELLGVAPRLRGRGSGRSLALAGLAAIARSGATGLSTATQAGGDGALGFYEKLGFTTRSAGLWFHYWPRLDPGR